MNNDFSSLFKYFFMPSREPPTREQKGFTIVTEVVILLLQGVVIMALLGTGLALSFAAIQAWGVEQSLPVLFVACGVALYITLLWLAERLADYERADRLVALVVALAVLLGVANGAWSLVQGSDGLDVAVMRVVVCGLLVVLGILAGLAMTVQADLRAGMVFMWILWAGAVVLYLLMPKLAEREVWPWLLSCMAVSFNYGAYFTQDAFKQEVKEPFRRGMPPTEEVKLEFLKWMLGQQMQAAPQSMPVDVWMQLEGGKAKLASLPGSHAEIRQFATDALADTLALDKTLPRTHPLWSEARERGLIRPRDVDKPTLGSVATRAGRQAFEYVLRELDDE